MFPFDPATNGLGWRHDLERPDEIRATSHPLPQYVRGFRLAPASLDPRHWLRIENQGPMGSCSGHSMSTCLEVLNRIATGRVVQLSRMLAYLNGQKESGTFGGDEGATISGSVGGATKYGICLEERFPYPEPVAYSTRIPAGALDEAGQHKIVQHASLESYDEVFGYIATGTGVVQIGIPWRESLAGNTSGVIEQSSGSNLGGHALAIVGYSERKDSRGRNYLIMANSHGTGWGRDGFAEIAPRLFDAWGRSGDCEMVGVTDLQAFGGPRSWDWVKDNVF